MCGGDAAFLSNYFDHPLIFRIDVNYICPYSRSEFIIVVFRLSQSYGKFEANALKRMCT